MCDPVTLGTIAVVGTAASAGVSAYGQIQKGKAAAGAANYNAQIADTNAAISLQNATFAGQKGAIEEGLQNMKTRAAVGSTLAQQGASGVDISGGSAADVRTSQAMLGQLDAATIRANAAREAYGYQVQAVNHEAEANLDRVSAKNAKKAAYLEAAGTLLGGAAKSSDYWGDYTRNKQSINKPGISYGASDPNLPWK